MEEDRQLTNIITTIVLIIIACIASIIFVPLIKLSIYNPQKFNNIITNIQQVTHNAGILFIIFFIAPALIFLTCQNIYNLYQDKKLEKETKGEV